MIEEQFGILHERTTMIRLTAKQALRKYKEAQPYGIWSNPAKEGMNYGDIQDGMGGARVYQDFIDLKISPKFKTKKGSSFFTAGSCFARNVERALYTLGENVLSWRPGLGIGNEYFHRYNTFSIINDFENALQGKFTEDLLVQIKNNSWIDYSAFGVAETKEKLKEARDKVIQVHGNVKSADVLILTLGLVEAWYDLKTERYLNITPSNSLHSHAERYELRITDYTENLAALVNFRSFLMAHTNPELKIIVTVSPVPFNATFSGEDVVVANMYSKSTLRSVAQAFSEQFDNVAYFPSYELVTLSAPDKAWLPDFRHVRPDFVDGIMKKFISTYCE
jgi:hypothetical protein